MLNKIRSTIFNIFFPIWTVLFSGVTMPFFFFSNAKTAGLAARCWARVSLGALKYICGITYQVSGQKNLPKNGICVLASKHQSEWDTVIFHILVASPVYVLKKELLKIPFFGWYLRKLDMIPIDRSGGTSSLKQMQQDVIDRIKKKHPVVIFPEGTRTKVGQRIKYQAGVFFIYDHKELQDIPFVPIALTSGHNWPTKNSNKIPGIIKLKYLPPIKKGLGRKEFMAKLEETIETECERLKP